MSANGLPMLWFGEQQQSVQVGGPRRLAEVEVEIEAKCHCGSEGAIL